MIPPYNEMAEGCMESVEAVHGHGGKTVVVWLDPEPGSW